MLVLIGSQAGLLLAVGLGQSVLRPWVERKVKEDRTLAALDKAVAKEGG